MKTSRTLKQLALTTTLLGLLLIGSANANIRDGIGLYSVGGSIGYVNSSGYSTLGSGGGGTIGLGLFADIGYLAENIAIYPNISYWTMTTEPDEFGFGYQMKEQEFSIGGDLHYYFNPEATVNYYLGAGLAMSFFKWQSGPLHKPESSLGFKFAGGLETRISEKASLVGELSYKVDGVVNTLWTKVGVAFNMFD